MWACFDEQTVLLQCRCRSCWQALIDALQSHCPPWHCPEILPACLQCVALAGVVTEALRFGQVGRCRVWSTGAVIVSQVATQLATQLRPSTGPSLLQDRTGCTAPCTCLYLHSVPLEILLTPHKAGPIADIFAITTITTVCCHHAG
jgi:hypothetical protein